MRSRNYWRWLGFWSRASCVQASSAPTSSTSMWCSNVFWMSSCGLTPLPSKLTRSHCSRRWSTVSNKDCKTFQSLRQSMALFTSLSLFSRAVRLPSDSERPMSRWRPPSLKTFRSASTCSEPLPRSSSSRVRRVLLQPRSLNSLNWSLTGFRCTTSF